MFEMKHLNVFPGCEIKETSTMTLRNETLKRLKDKTQKFTENSFKQVMYMS